MQRSDGPCARRLWVAVALGCCCWSLSLGAGLTRLWVVPMAGWTEVLGARGWPWGPWPGSVGSRCCYRGLGNDRNGSVKSNQNTDRCCKRRIPLTDGVALLSPFPVGFPRRCFFGLSLVVTGRTLRRSSTVPLGPPGRNNVPTHCFCDLSACSEV